MGLFVDLMVLPERWGTPTAGADLLARIRFSWEARASSARLCHLLSTSIVPGLLQKRFG